MRKKSFVLTILILVVAVFGAVIACDPEPQDFKITISFDTGIQQIFEDIE